MKRGLRFIPVFQGGVERGAASRRAVGRCLEAVEAFVEGPYEPGTVLGAAGGALYRLGQVAGGFAEDDFGEGAAAVVPRKGGGVALDVGGDCVGVPGQLEHVCS